LFLASICIAGILSLSQHSFSYTPKAGFVSSFILVALFIGVLALGFGLFKNSESLWYFQKSSYALNTQNDAVAAEGFMNKAISAMPYDVYYRSLAEIEISKIQAISAQDTTKVAAADIQKELATALPLAVGAGLSARDADPSNYLNWIELGRTYESAVPSKVSGAYQLSASAYNEALRRNPQNPGIYLLFAQLDIDQGNLDEAKQYAQAAISAKQDYLDAYYLLAQIEVDQKDLTSAIGSVTAATTLDPNDPALLFQLGVLQFNNSDFAGAITTLTKSLTLSPQYANAQYFLGLSYEANKDHADAIAQFQALQKTNPDNAQVATILKTLLAGKSIFTTAPATSATKNAALPVQEKQQ
jgi:cytochrome c-type biogenesis protein CcmH/NrfG